MWVIYNIWCGTWKMSWLSLSHFFNLFQCICHLSAGLFDRYTLSSQIGPLSNNMTSIHLGKNLWFELWNFSHLAPTIGVKSNTHFSHLPHWSFRWYQFNWYYSSWNWVADRIENHQNKYVGHWLSWYKCMNWKFLPNAMLHKMFF